MTPTRRFARVALFAWGVSLSMVSTAEAQPSFASSPTPVTFANGDVTLSGALLMPDGPRSAPAPAVVLLHGAGPGTHDEPAFRVHANAFVHAGFAVLVFDKRGSGKSTGDLDASDYDDLAGDVAAGVRLLRARADINSDRIGVLGRSEGGWVGALAASKDPRIAFVIMSSGSAVAPYGQTLFSTANALRAHGATPEEVKEASAAKAALWEYYRDVAKDIAWGRSDEGQLARAAVEARLKPFARFAPEIPQRVANPRERAPAFFQAFARKIYFEPEPVFRAVRAPLLEIIGANDDVVDAAGTVGALERLRSAGVDVTTRVLPDVDHTLLITTANGPRYPDDYPEFAVRWALEQLGRRAELHLGHRWPR